MSVRMGLEDIVVLNDPPSINQAFVKQHTKFSGRPVVPFFHQTTNGFGIIMRDYNDAWKTQRKFGITTLRGFGVGKQSLESRINEEASYLNEAISSENGKPFDISVVLHNAVSNIICSVAMGRRFSYDDKKFQELLHGFLRRFSDPVNNFMAILFSFVPILMKVPPFSIFNRRMARDSLAQVEHLRIILEEHEDTFDEGHARDFLDAFMVEMAKNSHSSFTRPQLLFFIRDLFFAGTETSSSTLAWALLCLIHYPEIQKKLYKEVVDIIGSSGVVSVSKRTSMPYTNAFIEELLRFRTLVPLGLQHKTSEDEELNGFFIPKGTTVMANLWAVHNDDKVWENPNVFRPERFLDEKENFIHSKNVIPFSVGPRHCLGEQLAQAEIFVFLVRMIQRFEILPEPSADQLPDIDCGSNGFVFTPVSFKMVANER